MNQQGYLHRVSQLLSRFSEQVNILNSNGEFSINIHAENCLIAILNIIFDCKLRNINYEENKFFPSIDLRDAEKRLAFQVTASSSVTKIKHTLSGFIDNGFYKDYDHLFIFIITNKQHNYKNSSFESIIKDKISFSKDCIIDKTDLYQRLNALNDIQKIQSVCHLLETQFADNIKDDKWDIYYKGLEEYDNYIVNLYEYLDIRGFSPRINNTLVRLSIDKIYVPLKFKFDYSNNDREYVPRGERTSYDITTALDTYNKIVILGDPGSGKSTSLKYLAYSICSHRISTILQSSYIPVFIKAADYSKYHIEKGRSLSEFIIDFSTKYGSLFSRGLDNNELIILIDGLDEINITNQRHVVVEQINSFVAQYPKVKIVVSSRIVGYRETQLSGSFFHFEVDKFSDEQIRAFINNWYSSISLYSDKDQTCASKEADKLFRDIKQNESVYKLASNPLLITIITLINYQGNQLPEKRVALYDIATTTLLNNWVNLRTSQNKNIDREVLIELLASVAFYIHDNYSSGLIPEKELRNNLTKYYSKIHPFLETKELRQDISDIISFLREDAGFLFEKGYNKSNEAVFGFIHLSFQEYFAAIEFNTKWKEGSIGKLNKYINNSSWVEVIKLAASLFKYNDPGRIGRSSATRFVKDILEEEDFFPDLSRRFYLVCQILNEDVEIEFDTLNSIIDALIESLSSPNDRMSDYQFGSSLHLLLLSTNYRRYLLDRVGKILTANNSTLLSRRLVTILMDSSDVPIVHEFLLSILKSDQEEIKSYLFDYNTVLPVADVVKTDLFRSEIVKYVNSDLFSKKYNTSLPTQYACCFDNGMEDWLLSISLVKDDKMKKDLIDFYVFSWGISDIDKLKYYYKTIKNSYPSFNLRRIENYLTELEKYHSLGIEKYPIIETGGFELYKREGKDTSYVMIHEKKVTLVERPFASEDFTSFLGNEASSFARFCNMIFTAENSESKEVIIRNDEDLELLINYYEAIHWFSSIHFDNAIMYAISHLFDNGSINEKIIHWIKRTDSIRRSRLIIDNSFDKDAFMEMVESSTLFVFDKLLLLKLVNPQFKDKELLSKAIEEYNKMDKSIDKSEYRMLLYDLI